MTSVEHAAGAATPRRRRDAPLPACLVQPRSVWVDSWLGDVATASRIASTGAVRPVQRSNDAAPWATRISSPSTTSAPRARAASRNRVPPSGRPCPPRSFRHPNVIGLERQRLERICRGRQPHGRAVDDDLGRLGTAARRAAELARRAPRRARACGSRRSTSAAPALHAAPRPRPAPAPPAPSTSARAPRRRDRAAQRARAGPARRCCRRAMRAVALERQRVGGADRPRGVAGACRRARAPPPCAGSSR